MEIVVNICIDALVPSLVHRQSSTCMWNLYSTAIVAGCCLLVEVCLVFEECVTLSCRIVDIVVFVCTGIISVFCFYCVVFLFSPLGSVHVFGKVARADPEGRRSFVR